MSIATSTSRQAPACPRWLSRHWKGHRRGCCLSWSSGRGWWGWMRAELSEVAAEGRKRIPQLGPTPASADRCRDVVEKAVESLGGFGRRDHLRARSLPLRALAEEPVEQWLDLMTTNVIASMLATRAPLEHLNEEGVLLYLSSDLVQIVHGGSHHGLGADTCASKAALNRSIQAWRTQLP